MNKKKKQQMDVVLNERCEYILVNLSIGPFRLYDVPYISCSAIVSMSMTQFNKQLQSLKFNLGPAQGGESKT